LITSSYRGLSGAFNGQYRQGMVTIPRRGKAGGNASPALRGALAEGEPACDRLCIRFD